MGEALGLGGRCEFLEACGFAPCWNLQIKPSKSYICTAWAAVSAHFLRFPLICKRYYLFAVEGSNWSSVKDSGILHGLPGRSCSAPGILFSLHQRETVLCFTLHRSDASFVPINSMVGFSSVKLKYDFYGFNDCRSPLYIYVTVYSNSLMVCL